MKNNDGCINSNTFPECKLFQNDNTMSKLRQGKSYEIQVHTYRKQGQKKECGALTSFSLKLSILSLVR